jgi:hypothetical protein
MTPEDADEGTAEATGNSPLAELLDDLAGEFADVERRESAGGTEFLVGAHVFARLGGATAEFRLRPEIAAAAARTPDVRASDRGPAWVAFGPRVVDQHAVDRAQAWFELGHRLAAEAGRRH